MIEPQLMITLLNRGSALFALLLLGSLIFPPKAATESMRFFEKLLMLVSAVMIVLWLIVLLTYAAPPVPPTKQGQPGQLFTIGSSEFSLRSSRGAQILKQIVA